MNKVTGLITNWIETRATHEEMLYIRNILDKKIKTSPHYGEVYHNITEYLLKGDMLSAVKLYKDLTGVGLKEAKDACELIRSQIVKTPGMGNNTFKIKFDSNTWNTNI